MGYKFAFVVAAASFAISACGGASLVLFPFDGGKDGGRDGVGDGGAGARDGQSDGDGSGGQSFGIGGSVTGLLGTGLVLADDAGNQLAILGNGTFQWVRVPSGAHVTITVAQQPSGPAQLCTVTGGDIPSISADVNGVLVKCATRPLTVGGTVTGVGGAGLVLQNNGADDLAITAAGAFVFPKPVLSGATFTVTIKSQPASPAHSCQVSGGSGTIGGASVTSVVVNCSANTYTIGGTIVGLVGTGLIIQNKADDDQALSANGSFSFPTPAHTGDVFTVTIKAQPAQPTQVCTVNQAGGTVATDNVHTVAIACATRSFVVSGTVSGLAGAGLVLQDNLRDNLAITAVGPFSFPTPVASRMLYAVTVLAQPTSPSQTCTVTAGGGIMTAAAVTTVRVVCSTNNYLVGGTVTGLAGSGLVLRNQGVGDLTLAADGVFVFALAAPSGAPFAVSIATQPTNPSQTCTIAGGTGTIGAADVHSVVVNCTTDQHIVGGTLANLAGAGFTLSLNGGTPQAISGSGAFAFPMTLPSGGAYSVAIVTQPTSPWQVCTLSGGGGTIAATDITTVAVSCVTNRYVLGGTVQGLAGTGLALENNDGAPLALAADGTFVFPTDLVSGTGYHVGVAASPTGPTQTCVVTNGSGVIAGAAVTNVAVSCTTNTYPVGGSVTGLAGTVVLRNGADSRALTANGTFAFVLEVASGAPYAVTIGTQPTAPDQTCTVTAGSGAVTNAAITTVSVSCITNRYTVGGSQAGLLGGGLVLQNNLGNDLTVTPGATFTFTTPVDSGRDYAVSIKTQPTVPTQTCSIVGGTGTVGASNVASVTLNCITNSYVVGGTVTGLLGEGLVVQNNGLNDRLISGPGSFAFSPPLASGLPYAVTVKTQPTNPWQSCTLTGGSGTVSSADILVPITCVTRAYPVSVTVTGLAGSGLILQNNVSDNLTLTTNGTAAFPTLVDSGNTYGVAVLSQPANPRQICTVTLPAGTVAGAGVTVAVACVTSGYTIGGTITGVQGTGLRLRDNGGDLLSATGNGAFTFSTPVLSGAAYAVTIAASPTSPEQGCEVTRGSGTVGSTDVTDVVVTCFAVNSCITNGEHDTLTLACPTGRTIQTITFASYGTPNGTCADMFTLGGCHAGNSTMKVEALCLGRPSCTVPASNDIFGDPCGGTLKRLSVTMACSAEP